MYIYIKISKRLEFCLHFTKRTLPRDSNTSAGGELPIGTKINFKKDFDFLIFNQRNIHTSHLKKILQKLLYLLILNADIYKMKEKTSIDIVNTII